MSQEDPLGRCLTRFFIAQSTQEHCFSPRGCSLRKIADISRRLHWYTCKITSEERVQKFYTDYSLSRICVVLLIGRLAWKTSFDLSEALSRSGQRHNISMEFLRLFLRCHFTKEAVVASRNVRCFLRIPWMRSQAIAGLPPAVDRHAQYPCLDLGKVRHSRAWLFCLTDLKDPKSVVLNASPVTDNNTAKLT